jgi:penicillin-binding protein 1A
MEMTSAYQIFANRGTKVEPYFIEAIYDRDGRLLEQHEHEEEEILSPETAYLMCSLLRTVVTSGTGASIPRLGFTRPAGGKTGTTNDYSDAWFVGFTPQITCAVWVGIDERRSMGHGVTGSRGAIPIWVPTMAALHRDLPEENFEAPEGIVRARICNQTHLVNSGYCPAPYEEEFRADVLPDTCDVHLPGVARRKKGGVIDLFGSGKNERRRVQPAKDEEPKRKRKRKLMF